MEHNTKAFNRINTITSSYFAGEKELAERVKFVKTVIMNTLRKFPAEMRPEELNWAMRGARYTGFEFRDYNDKVVEITESNPISHKHVLSFYIINKKNWNSEELTVTRGSFPAALLFNDPMAISQYARTLIRNKQSQLRYKEVTGINKQVEDLTQKLEQLEKDRAKLEQERLQIRQRNQLARETINKNRVKQEKRKAAKLLKTNS